MRGLSCVRVVREYNLSIVTLKSKLRALSVVCIMKFIIYRMYHPPLLSVLLYIACTDRAIGIVHQLLALPIYPVITTPNVMLWRHILDFS